MPETEVTTQAISFSFEGQKIDARTGMSLAAALASAGEYQLRAADEGQYRGVFCGIGVCQECAVEIQGVGRVRACMTPVAPDLVVTRAGRRAIPGCDTRSARAESTRISTEPDVLVIGGGAGGLTAAACLAEAGADVMLLDERSTAGGQFYKQARSSDTLHASLVGDRQMNEGGRLADRALASGARIVQEAEVWGAFEPAEFAVLHEGVTTIVKPKRTIVATGTVERGLAVPGWTLPGVMTCGAAQTLLKSYGVLAGKRVLVSGNGPLNLQVAQELKRAGATVVAVTELAPAFAWSPVAASRMFWQQPRLSLRGLRNVAGLTASRVPLLFRHTLHSIEKTEHGLRAWTGPFHDNKVERSLQHDVDVVCMGFGFLPSNEILRCLGCQHEFDKTRRQLTTIRSEDCETSVSGVYAIGDCCGLRGAPAACEEGIIAAAAVLRSLSRTAPEPLRTEEKTARARLRKHLKFQSALWSVFQAPQLNTELADPETIICRCENVTLHDIRQSLSDCDSSIGAIKRRTRIGMGPCQGRYCAPVVAEMLAAKHGKEPGEYSFFAPRAPIKPIRISDIVTTKSESK